MSAPAAESSVWDQARLVAALFAVDPAGLGGVIVRAGPGPVRDAWLTLLRTALPAHVPVRRVPLNIEDDRLLGGLDLTASLAAGRPIAQRGVLAECDGGIALLPMAERLSDAVGARLAAVLDRGEVVIERDGLALRTPARLGLVVLDEGLAPEERPPEALEERSAFLLNFEDVSPVDRLESDLNVDAVFAARGGLAVLAPASSAVIEALCEAALALGLVSVRAPLLALAAARAHAALRGGAAVEVEDAAAAVRLVLLPRARALPATEEPQPSPSEGPADTPALAQGPQPDPAEAGTQTEQSPPTDTERMVAAVRGSLPDDLMSRLRLDPMGRNRPTRSSGAGAKSTSARRGRPVGSRQGALRPGDRLNLVETLRAAAPWRKLRGGEAAGRLPVRPQDFRIRRFVQSRDSTTIFVVDASGSTAFQRLAEAKGAVELLLARAYVTRARVALIGFRHTGAELLLPPTRSLTRAKRRLAELPGGGGTPLASGLEAALRLAKAEVAQDRTPMLVVLTDGRANIGRDGSPGRAGALADALAAARRIGEAKVAGVYLDTSPRPQPDGDRFAHAMGAVYAPLPYVDARTVSTLVEDLRAR